jgi:hypothetical protein
MLTCNKIRSLLTNLGMSAGSYLFLPGGWAGEEEDVPLLYVLERRNAGTYAFYVVNTNQFATQYHPIVVDSNECGIPTIYF